MSTQNSAEFVLLQIGLVLLTIGAIALTGCGDPSTKIVPVSGTVTFEGQPLADAEVIFAPMERTDEMNAGPASIGRTDENGRYSLSLQSGKRGAQVGSHRVGITGSGQAGGNSDEEMSTLIDIELQKNPNMSPEEYRQLEQRVIQRMEAGADQGGVLIPAAFNLRTVITFEVPSGGTTEANFDLKSDGTWK